MMIMFFNYWHHVTHHKNNVTCLAIARERTSARTLRPIKDSFPTASANLRLIFG